MSLRCSWPVIFNSSDSRVLYSAKCFSWCKAVLAAAGPRKSQISFNFLTVSISVYLLSATEIPSSAKALKSFMYFNDCFLNAPGIKKPMAFITNPEK